MVCKVTPDYIKASWRQCTKYKHFQIPINWAIFFQPFSLPHTHTHIPSCQFCCLCSCNVTWIRGLTPLNSEKAGLRLLKETEITCPCKQTSIKWWICHDTIQEDRNYNFANSMVLQNIAKNRNKNATEISIFTEARLTARVNYANISEL